MFYYDYHHPKYSYILFTFIEYREWLYYEIYGEVKNRERFQELGTQQLKNEHNEEL